MDNKYPTHIVAAGAFVLNLAPLLATAMHLRSLSMTDAQFYEQAAKVKSQIMEVVHACAQNLAIRRIQELELDGYVLGVEGPYKHDGGRDAAVSFMNRLKSVLGDYPLALSSYRYPSWHPQIPWNVFLEGCEINMPQFYWEGAHNPREQLLRCQSEFTTMPHVRPIIPRGAAYTEHGWRPTVEEVVDAMWE